jgi:hypothetical protein
MDWQTPIAIGLATAAGAYVLWRWLRPFFADEDHPAQQPDELLQIEQPDD